MYALERAKEIIVKKIMEIENAEIYKDLLIIYPPYTIPTLQKLYQKWVVESDSWEEWLILDMRDDMLGLPSEYFWELCDYFHILGHCKFTGKYAETAAQGARMLAHLRPGKKLRFYAYLSTIAELNSLLCVDEVLTLEELLQRGEVWTADALVADNVIRGLAPEEQYLATLKRVRSIKDVPVYTHQWNNTIQFFATPITHTRNLRTNEFMLVLKD